ncbi:hypothetical protein [Actinokineospora inagensis]|uniref:hypothetical protein n=1 Tax=Actinokineospora inagensis TaxID=103730 RepID=UPI0003F7472B|nr:hypothetical protein [Actinokineospora inagensis]
MLAVSAYTPEYITTCRTRIANHITTYHAVHAAAPNSDAMAAFEPVFFNNLLLALEMSFVHRLRAKEKKDCNPLTEVRFLATSLLTNDGVFTVTGMKWTPTTSTLGYTEGDPITIREPAFQALATAFFTDLTTKYA